ncbi:MAG: hypothetical protein QXH24_01925 [Candidatus Bathyarchaeia archaeon]
MLQEKLKNIKVGSIIIIFDRDFGRLIFRNVRIYENLLDDAEWLLERTPQRSWGFMIRSIIKEKHYGLWIGEYMPDNNKVIREEMLFSKGSSVISKILLKHSENRVSDKEVDRKINIDTLKKMLPESNIIRDFKHFTCPEERFYNRCPCIEEIYKIIGERCSYAPRLYYSRVAEIIFRVNKCHDVIICPLQASPNALERIFVLTKILQSRRIGKIKVIGEA